MEAIMATFPDTTLLPENRPDLEALVEAAIARLDELDGDVDLGPCCEDEGAQCEDEGSYDVASGLAFGAGDCCAVRFPAVRS